ncbi:IS110 family transposase, partial [Metallibacterium scheffleri]|uniref:IS110 family transposase n=1 Tax=Metallibacterium scheffleri TaxID=993689 RepID=UPI0023F3A2BC
MKITTVGIDLAKNVFQLHGVDRHGKTVLRKQIKRDQMAVFFANLPTCLIGMEACGSAHHWARKLQGMGHTVRLMAPQFVKPYVKTNKNDAADAEAICEAVGRPNMRFVPIKNIEQQSVLALHRVRQGFVKARTAQANQIRGLLLERGITLRQGRRHVDRALPGILEDADARLSGALRLLLAQLKLELEQLTLRIEDADAAIEKTAQEKDACRRLVAIPGIGPVTATALIAAIGNGA